MQRDCLIDPPRLRSRPAARNVEASQDLVRFGTNPEDRATRAPADGQPVHALPLRRAGRVGAQHVAKPIKGSRILILGASYKGGVGDVRESPALRIIEVLASRGGIVSHHDEYVPSLSRLGLESVPLDEFVAEADAVVRVTAQPENDHAAIAARSALFVDLRGVTRGLRSPNLVRL